MMHGLTTTRARLAGGVAMLALSAGAAMAQGQAPAVEQVIVSSTRLQNAGFDAPTPTTVMSAADLEKQAQPNIFEAVTQLPALEGSSGVTYNTGSTTTGLQGLSGLNLRGLGIIRTLVLMDSQRVVPANPNGAVDVSQMPQLLIQRVDVVTGGASASWGSDAVAGVVNFVTDKRFEGFKFNASAGLSTFGDDATAVLQAAAGTSLMGGRLHIEGAVEYHTAAGVQPRIPVSYNQFGPVIYPGGRQFFSQIGTPGYSLNSSGAGLSGVPAGYTGPRYIYGDLAQDINNYPYVMVNSGPKQGTIFGANGQAAQFDYAGGCTPLGNGGFASSGKVSGAIGSTCLGTAADPGDQTARQFTHSLIDPIQRGTFYGRVSYDLTDNTEVYATINISNVRTQNIPAQGNSNKGNIGIKCDNAFLPQSGMFGIGLSYADTIAACNTAYAAAAFNGVTATQIANGTQTATGAPMQGFSITTTNGNMNLDQIVNMQRDMRRYVVGGDGAFNVFDTDFTWDSYFQHGENNTAFHILNMPLKNRFNLAMDAIQLADGSIVCRDPAARANGCVPFNPFGTSMPSPAAIAYIDNQAHGAKVGGPEMRQWMRQEAFGLNFNTSPVKNWAGDISVAFGYDYREEAFAQWADPYSGGITSSSPANALYPCTDPSIDCQASGGATGHVNPGNWNAGNYTGGEGNYHVNEVFAEFGIPLINDSTWGKADLDLAGRFERYSTAGDIVAWKVGLTWDTPIPGVRLRTLQSRDVRAPNLADLFLPRQTKNGGFCNLFADPNCTSNQVMGETNAGNPLLKPEKGQTTQIGVVYQPDFLPGFQASFDYYRIIVKGIITSSGPGTVETLCFQGISAYCSQQFIQTKNGQPQTTAVGNQGLVGDPNQVLSITGVPFNSAGLLTDGFDIEASYQFDLQDWDVPGDFVARILANHTMKFISDPLQAGQFATEAAGVLGGGFNSSTYSQSTGNVLTWKVTGQQSWQGDVLGLTLTERWFADGVMRGKWLDKGITSPGNKWIVCSSGCPTDTNEVHTTNYQYVPAVLYMDIGATYNWTDSTQLYVKVNNAFNTTPPNTGNSEVNNTLYDVIGRFYQIGIRINN
ncbi:MAG TPA: TonB-dependent receptor [Rhizomicrobium sp.]|jgi:outer membrane receptor protein involved in Fe transport|nr:TonB-dependent receptor [Rhizomicrobium sp.]